MRFFKRSGEAWAQQGPSIVPPKIKTQSYFGGAFAISGDGNTALVKSGYGECCYRKAEPRPEVVYVYDRSGETWNMVEMLHSASKRNFGRGGGIALSEDGTLALIREERHGFPLVSTTWTR